MNNRIVIRLVNEPYGDVIYNIVCHVEFNGKDVAFSSYEAALLEARFLFNYVALNALEGKSDAEGLEIVRIDTIVRDPIKSIHEDIETIIASYYGKAITKLGLEKWGLK